MSRVLGRPVTYIPGAEAPFIVMMMIMGVTATPREHVIKVARMVREHRLARVHTTLQDLGIKPIGYEQFLRDFVEGRTGGGNSFEPPDTLMFRMLSAVMPAMMRLMLRVRGR
jgi:hypothetical protein